MNLYRLTRAELPVPQFFVVTTSAFRSVFQNQGRSEVAGSGGEFGHTLVQREIAQAYMKLVKQTSRELVAVRSSAAFEDSASASFAGQFLSILGVSGERELIQAIWQCWTASASERVRAYSRSKNLAGDNPIGIIVQRQVASRVSGVAFSSHPLTHDPNVVYIEANFGTGESVVGGVTTPDAFEFDRTTRCITKRLIREKKVMTVVDAGTRTKPIPPSLSNMPSLMDTEVAEVAGLVERIEQAFGKPQDVEWSYEEKHIYILQARPISA